MRKVIISTLLILWNTVAAFSAPVHLVDEVPVEIRTVAPGVFLVDFGRVAFGNLRLAGRTRLACNGKPLPATAKDGRLFADQPIGPGHYEIKLVAR